MANELDELMDLDPLELSAKDLDSIIAYHRQKRADRADGIKPKRESGPKVGLGDLVKGMIKEPKVEVTVKRRI